MRVATILAQCVMEARRARGGADTYSRLLGELAFTRAYGKEENVIAQVAPLRAYLTAPHPTITC